MLREQITKNFKYGSLQLILCAVLTLIGIVGCATERFNWRSTFNFPETPLPENGQASISAKIERLEGMEKRIKRMEPAEQSEIATMISAAYEEEPETAVRHTMAKTLGLFATPAAIPGLNAALQDSNPDIRIEAIRSLSRIGSPQALQLLIGVNRSDLNLDVRQAATQELGKFESAEATAALGQALDDADPAIQYLAMQSLRKNTGKNLGNDVRLWKQLVNDTATPTTTQPEVETPETVAGQSRDLK
ncbi:MAG: HEAT repeat domain-containing protein [Planctomycetaceae bacterium]|nr:HEAT repeat domain-containing protein [Planctomycetaceae bacterium]